MMNVLANPKLMHLAPVILYRTLGPTLPQGLAPAAVLWGAVQQCVAKFPESVARAGFDAKGPLAAEQLFDAILDNPSGVIFSVDEAEECWKRVHTPNGRIQLAIGELLDELLLLDDGESAQDAEFPFVLSAGERRSFTANTILRNPEWRKKDALGALRLNPTDAKALGVASGDDVKLTTKRASVRVSVEVSEMMQPGHVSLPNGLGLGYPKPGGDSQSTGVAPNELTASLDRDGLAGTPWHKHVPARIEALG